MINNLAPGAWPRLRRTEKASDLSGTEDVAARGIAHGGDRYTGPKQYFEVPLTKALDIFTTAFRSLPGLARAIR
ncbi:hypothetical protein [Streptomyces sp. NPDC054901]